MSETKPNESFYYREEFRLSDEMERLEKSDISEVNKQVIKNFQIGVMKNAGQVRAAKVCSQMRIYCGVLKKDILDVYTEDIEKANSIFKNNPKLSPSTKEDYMVRLPKQFYHWYKPYDKRLDFSITPYLFKLAQNNLTDKEKEELAKKIESLEEKKKEALKMYLYVEETLERTNLMKDIKPSDLIDNSDVQTIVDDGCNKEKEKALFTMLDELGVRINCLGSMNIGHIKKIHKNYIEIEIYDKKIKKWIPRALTSSMGYLLKYLEVHPSKNDPNAPLWMTDARSGKYSNKRMKYGGLRAMMERCLIRAGYIKIEKLYDENGKLKSKHIIWRKKRANPHWFRHSRISKMAGKLPEQVIKVSVGWSKDTRMLSTYNHMSDNVAKAELLRSQGVEISEEEQPKPIKCSMCSSINQPTAKYCQFCNHPLDPITFLKSKQEADEQLTATIKKMVELLQDNQEKADYNEFKLMKEKTQKKK